MKASLKSGAFFVYFCNVKWIGNRISFSDQKDKTTIVIDPSKNVWISAKRHEAQRAGETDSLDFLGFLVILCLARHDELLLEYQRSRIYQD